MRPYTLIATLSVLSGCSGQAGDPSQGTLGSATPEVGKVRQASQFATDSVLNLVDTGPTTLYVTADGNPVDVQVFYVGDKTTDTGHQIATPTLVDTLSLASDQTKTHTVNIFNPALSGGYGSIFLSAIQPGPTNVFQTYAEYGSTTFSVGGSVFQGSSYRIPYPQGTFRIVLAITNQSDFSFEVDIENLGAANVTAVTLDPLSTYKFDSFAEHWTLNGTSAVQIFTNASGTVALSGYEDRLFRRVRVSPVKAAPF